MKQILRRIRGALANAVTWSVGWSLVGSGITALALVLGPAFSWPVLLNTAITFAGLGFLAGGGFSIFLGIAGRRSALEELNPRRFAVGAGLVGGILVPGLQVAIPLLASAPIMFHIPSTITLTVLSATLAAGTAFSTIRLAQQALPDGSQALGILSTSGESLPGR